MRLALLCVAASALALSGCATAVAPSTQVVIADTGTTVDLAYNAAAQAYLAVAPSLDAATKVKVKALFVQAYAYVQAADTAVTAGDSGNLAVQITSAMSLIAQINALLPAKS